MAASYPRCAVDGSSALVSGNPVGRGRLSSAWNENWCYVHVSSTALALIYRLTRVRVDAVELCLVVGNDRLCVYVFDGGLASLSVFRVAVVMLRVPFRRMGGCGGDYLGIWRWLLAGSYARRRLRHL
ncbi:hypothetical protein Trco_005404 [Trichoderma cornu-damae]|uniref:Uncharacterized protein n=1 Tax=Trichoderma cornu-damae TaxID=654480 RepID=A0A9P8QHA0_9HYPO|nr:hypothetical protein Trco_005404 [Trichoderma cornu-damae]